jgi:hypothetical protein
MRKVAVAAVGVRAVQVAAVAELEPVKDRLELVKVKGPARLLPDSQERRDSREQSRRDKAALIHRERQ